MVNGLVTCTKHELLAEISLLWAKGVTKKLRPLANCTALAAHLVGEVSSDVCG
jgi:hypothetical protein